MMHCPAVSTAVALLAVSCSAQSLSAIYNGGYNSTNAAVGLRIGDGGAGIEYLSTGLPDVGIIEEYTITGRGTMLSLDAELTNRAVVYKAGSDEASDPLLNLVHLHVGAKAPNPDRAAAFAEWVISDRGHSVIAGFEKNGQKLYSPAPSNLSDSTLERCSLRMPSYARLY